MLDCVVPYVGAWANKPRLFETFGTIVKMGLASPEQHS